MPHFVSWVIAASLISKILSVDGGVINDILIGMHIIQEPIQFLAIPKAFWWISTFADIWKELGWNSIIFLAAIANIDPTLYEGQQLMEQEGGKKSGMLLFLELAQQF